MTPASVRTQTPTSIDLWLGLVARLAHMLQALSDPEVGGHLKHLSVRGGMGTVRRYLMRECVQAIRMAAVCGVVLDPQAIASRRVGLKMHTRLDHDVAHVAALYRQLLEVIAPDEDSLLRAWILARLRIHGAHAKGLLGATYRGAEGNGARAARAPPEIPSPVSGGICPDTSDPFRFPRPPS